MKPLTLFEGRDPQAEPDGAGRQAAPGGARGGRLSAGLALMERGAYERALEEFRLAAAEAPDCAAAFYNMGQIHDRFCQYRKSAECNGALALDPAYAPAHYTLGLVYLDLRDKTRAAEQHQILKRLDPVLSEHLYHLINR